jgi:hypothetical protein
MAPSKRANPSDDTAHVTSGSSSNRPKRTRISRACDQCRNEKEKCDGNKPRCLSCVTAGRPCSYDKEQKKRGPRTGHARALECTLAWVFENVPQAEERVAGMLSTQNQALLGGTSETLQQKWSRCRVNKRIQRFLDDPRPDRESPGDEDDSSTDEVVWEVQQSQAGHSAQQEPQLTPAAASWTSGTSYPANSLRPVDGYSPFSAIVATPQSKEGQQRRIMLPPNHRQLLHVYFTYTHNWLPLVDRTEILDTVTKYASSGAIEVSKLTKDGRYAALWSVLAVAAFPQAHITPLDDTMNTWSPQEIYQTARGLIPPLEDCRFDIGHVIALLLLGVIQMGRGNNEASSLLVGTAVRISLHLGLHEAAAPVSPEIQSFPQNQIIFATCFLLDTLLSAALHRIRHLQSIHMPRRLSFWPGLPEESHRWIPIPGFGNTRLPGDSSIDRFPLLQSLSCFDQTYRLSIVLNDASDVPLRQGKGDMRALGEALEPAFAYCNSVVPPPSSSGSAGILQSPAGVLVHVAFLSTAMFLEASQRISQLWVFLELLENHVAIFGVAGIPIPVLGYMSLVESRGFMSNPGMDNSLAFRWKSLVEAVREVWRPHSPPSTQLGSVEPAAASASPQHMRQPEEVTAAMDPGHSGRRNQLQDARNYLPPRLGDLPPNETTGLGFGLGGMTGYYPDLQIPQPMDPLPHLHGGHGLPTVDIDAALAEMAEIDVFDNNMDAEREFLANLGFVPGINSNELFGIDLTSR